MAEYSAPKEESTIYNTNNFYLSNQTSGENIFDETLLLDYVKKTGDTMSGALSSSGLNLYGPSSKLKFDDNSELRNI